MSTADALADRQRRLGNTFPSSPPPDQSQVTDHKSLRPRRTFLQVDPGYDYDPMDPMSFNLYAYVRGNPVMGTDPDGMAEEEAEEVSPARLAFWRNRGFADSGLNAPAVVATGETPGDIAVAILNAGIQATKDEVKGAAKKGAEATKPVREGGAWLLGWGEWLSGRVADDAADAAMIAFAFPEPTSSFGGAPVLLSISEVATVIELECSALKMALVPSNQNLENFFTKLKKAAGGLIIARVSRMAGISKEFTTSLYNYLWKSTTSSGGKANGN